MQLPISDRTMTMSLSSPFRLIMCGRRQLVTRQVSWQRAVIDPICNNIIRAAWHNVMQVFMALAVLLAILAPRPVEVEVIFAASLTLVPPLGHAHLRRRRRAAHILLVSLVLVPQ